MFKRILTPLDGSILAQRVLPHVLTLVQTFHSAVDLVTVVEPIQAREKTHLDPLNWHLRKAEAETYLQNVRQQWPTAMGLPEIVLLEGAAADRIIEYADEQDHDLIVLSSHGESGLSPWNISSVVQKIIHYVGRSVMIVRAYQTGDEDMTPRLYRRILVPLDGSKRAECVLPLASRLAQQNNAQLILAHVVARPHLLQSDPPTPRDEELITQLVTASQEQATAYLQKWQAHLSPSPEIRLLLASDIPGALQELADQSGADLIVMSAHGHSGGKRPYGSVVTNFIIYGVTPLLILQDLPQTEIQQTKAEMTAHIKKGNGIPNINYAQPSFWSPAYH
ncbi:MAG: universal stress protein [Chloroflexi bacterium]|nr:universal stress protein [Chloroflexota bacterium]MBP8059576.1 universal stress protein [Chloroflexota bacterium]